MRTEAFLSRKGFRRWAAALGAVTLLLAPGLLLAAITSDRFGGFEDCQSYGEGAGLAAPAVARAYEALIVAQSAQSGRRPPIENRHFRLADQRCSALARTGRSYETLTAYGQVSPRGASTPAMPAGGEEPMVLPSIGGTWYREGIRSLPASISQSGPNLVFSNEFKPPQVSRGHFISPREVVADDWQGGLHGVLSEDGRHIAWANGSNWSR